jgi:hypothetical protein
MTFPLHLVPISIVAALAAAVGLFARLTGRDRL